MNKKIIFVAILMLVLVFKGEYLLDVSSSFFLQNEQAPTPEKKILFYRNSMNPTIISPVPTKDNMGMDYIPVYKDDTQTNDPIGTVSIDPVIVQNIGVRTEKVKLGNLSKTIQAVGRIDFDEEKMVRLHSKTNGWVEKLFVNKIGETIQKDIKLLDIYSPTLFSTQQEYLLALKNYQLLKNSEFPDIRKGAKNLLESTYQRLKLLDVPEHQIKSLEESKKISRTLHIHSPTAGTVIQIGVREGQYITPTTELYMLADLSRVWVYIDIYEYEIPWVKLNDKIEMTLQGIPNKTFFGYVDYIYPYAESKTRTIKVRAIFQNKNLELRPQMFANITLYVDEQTQAIIIPTEAVIRSGVKNRVFVMYGAGKFEPRIVTLGLESEDKVIILSGLKEDEIVVTSAQFLIDSESSLREAIQKMTEIKNSDDVDKGNVPHD